MKSMIRIKHQRRRLPIYPTGWAAQRANGDSCVVSLAFGIALFFMLFASIAGAGERKENFFPLMAWDDAEDEATIKKMAECGVNLIAFVPPRLLNACQKYHVQAIVFDPRVTPNWDQPFDSKRANAILPELIKKYNRHPAVYGYH